MKTISIISRGIPGSGKSTFNRILRKTAAEKGYRVNIHSTDDKFMVDGEYVFDPSNLYKYHMQNLREFEHSVDTGIDIVVVDNTNIKAREYKSYITASDTAGYFTIAVYFVPDAIDKHLARQTHGVPEEALVRMRESIIASGTTIGVSKEYVIKPEDFSESYLQQLCDTIISHITE